MSNAQRAFAVLFGSLWRYRLASGYEITCMYSDAGTQVIRDRYGGILTRPAHSADLSAATVHAEPMNKLAALVSRIDNLFAAIRSEVER